ncbi:MAG TPA: XrtA/PEP-CTERM system TPR-repeat protein PrsT [Falsiroseomonas sp.]|jgi:putative PEP-CTERM system TPR-repeat lipoprotein|nr:XrtA/PEP-CTERM system TPR-repeat protein PrsT [Falsiroseomonas sp.]
MATPPNAHRTRLLLAALLAAGIGIGEVAAQPLQRARAAQDRGDLRTAQIELRNAVRAEPENGAVRAALAAVSLELGDAETADREARAALERGHDPAGTTALLLRSYIGRARFEELLRDFPLPDATAQPGVAAQVAAGRAIAQLARDERDAARESVAAALRLGPNVAEVQLAAASLALVEGDRAAAEAAVDRALAANPDAPDALIRKASFQAERGTLPVAIETLGRLLAKAPGHVPARVLRGELLIRSGEDDRAREDIAAAMRVAPGNVPATYLTAMLQARARDWRAADETLQRLNPVLPNLGDGLLLLATVKRALGQNAQAEDAAQRYFARRPEDPRGGKLLATMQMETNRHDAASATLERLVGRGGADAESYDLLGRAHAGAGRPREAVRAFEEAVGLSPEDSGIRARLAAARLAMGDSAGTTRAAEESLRISPGQAGAREMLAVAALARGDLPGAQTELDRLDATQRRSEAAGTIDGLLKLARFEVAAARTAFETVMRDHPETIGARLGLARVATAQGNAAEAERLLGEVLRRAPSNPEALGRLVATATSRGPRAGAARVVLETAQAAAPSEVPLALALTAALGAANEAARALAVLNTDEFRRAGHGPALPMARSMTHASLGQWVEAEQAARAALAEDANAVQPRRQLVALLLRAGNTRNALSVAEEGLRLQPGNAAMQQLLAGVVRQVQGEDAALALADRLAQAEASRPASLTLRGDLLLAAQRPADAAQALADAHARYPSSELAQRAAAAFRAAGQADRAMEVVTAWLARQPEDIGALNMAAQIDIQAGRNAAAEARLLQVMQRAPDNAVALNNLAWLLADRGGPPELARARPMAQRAYLMLPNAETADTLGWILARQGETERAVALLRLAVNAPRPQGQPLDPGKAFRLATALRTAGQQAEALRLLEPVLATDGAFAERAAAERLLADLRAGR